MKSVLAASAVLLVAGSAFAAGNESFLKGPYFFEQHTTAIGNDPIIFDDLTPSSNNKVITGIKISFDYDEVNAAGGPALDASWASDLGMILDFGTIKVGFGGSFRNLGQLAGAYTLAAAQAAVNVYDIWDFDGSGSGSPGFYSHEFEFVGFVIPKPEFVTLSLTDTWDGNTLYSNFKIEFVKIPTPGAVALFGLAGLAAARRRRA